MAMSAQTPRGKAYTDAEIDSLLETIEDILPCCSNHWETVRSTHTSYYPDLSRTTESLKRKLPLSTTTKSQPEIPLVLPKCIGLRLYGKILKAEWVLQLTMTGQVF